jgi:class 3 adenylate cyclase
VAVVPFIDDNALLAAVASLLQQDPADLAGTFWDGVIAKANATAFNQVVELAEQKGYTDAQIQAFARGAEFQESLGIYWALKRASATHAYDQAAVDAFNRLDELAKALVVRPDPVKLNAGVNSGPVAAVNPAVNNAGRACGPGPRIGLPGTNRW